MNGSNVRRARRWFWALTVIAVVAMGGLYRELHAPASAGTGLLVLLSGTVLAAASVQAARILVRLAGLPRFPRRRRERGRRRDRR
jgi:hypothetical protein